MLKEIHFIIKSGVENLQIIHTNNDGTPHNLIGCAVIDFYPNGNIKKKSFIVDGHYHNESGPAVIAFHNNKNISYLMYYVDGGLHNIKGLAYIKYDKSGEIILKEYWLNNNQISVKTDEEFQKYIKRLNIS